MSKLAPVSMAIIAKSDAAEMAAFIATNANAAKVTFLNVGKGMFALEAKVGVEEAKAFYKKAGVSEHTIKNARQAVNVWNDVVVPGHATEAWFDSLVYMDCVIINRAIAKVTVKALVEDGLFLKRPSLAYGGFELAADTGTTRLQREAAEAAKKDTAAVVANTPGTTVPATAPSAAKAKAVPASISAHESVIKKVDAAEEAILKHIDLGDEVAAHKVFQRLIAMKMAVETALAKKFPAVDASALQQVATRATA